MPDQLEKVSHYKVIEKLGEGGMGEVYLVTDTKLHRKAALKLLPAGLARDRRHLNRFLQEARLAATLNHPNICTVYEIQEEGERPFIAMEHVEGETLAEKIDGRNLSVGQLVEIALQISDALDEAHRSGIIHRDIKAANVIINNRGRVKVLDFGLAKHVDWEISEQEVTRAKTESGMLIGTVQYMSPEQALGMELDGRTDLWSLGVLLYEMATGELPFKGSTVAATFDAILHHELISPAESNKNLPFELEQIILKLLERDRELRYQTASDLRADLRRLQRSSFDEAKNSGRPSSASSPFQSLNNLPARQTGQIKQTTAGEKPGSFLKSQHLAAFAFGLVFLTVLAGFAYRFYFNTGDARNIQGFRVGEAERLSSLGKVTDAAISPDGKFVTYVTNEGDSESLWLKQIQSGSNLQVVSPANVSFQGIAISPDNSWIYYNVWDRKGVGEIFRIPIFGGIPQRIVHDCMPGITLSPDGKRLAFIRSDSAEKTTKLMSAAFNGSDEREILVTASDDGGIFSPTWSPDGQTIAFGSAKLISPGKALAEIHEIPFDGGERKVIWTSSSTDAFFGNNLVWLPDKSGFLVTSGTAQQSYLQIWKISLSDGRVEQLTKDFNSYGNLSLSADGALLVSTQEDLTLSVWTVPVGNPSEAKKITSGKQEGFGVAWTPDNRIVYGSTLTGIQNIWIMNADGGNKKQLTTEAINLEPCVANNGEHILFTSLRGGSPNIWRMNIDGSNLKQLTETNAWLATCTPSGGAFFVTSGSSVGLSSIEGGPIKNLVDNVARRPAISPDGKRLAYIIWNNDRQQLEPEILNVETGEKKRFELPSEAVRSINQPPLILRWTPDGKGISYIRDENEVSNIWTLPVDGGKPRQATNFNESYIAYFDWSPDGKHLAVSRGYRTSDVVLVKNAK